RREPHELLPGVYKGAGRIRPVLGVEEVQGHARQAAGMLRAVDHLRSDRRAGAAEVRALLPAHKEECGQHDAEGIGAAPARHPSSGERRGDRKESISHLRSTETAEAGSPETLD